MKTGKTSVVDVPAPVVRSGFALVRNQASLVSAGTERMLVEFAEKNLAEKALSRPDLVKQVLNKARKEGVLATIEAAFNRLDQPMPLGYSSAGVIVELGAGMNGFQVGDRVACAGGGFAIHAEYVLVPRNLLVKIEGDLPAEQACFATLGAVALHGFRLANPQVGERVAIIGMGLLGLLAAGIARVAGCDVFGIDLSAGRVQLARELGYTAVERKDCEEAAREFSRGQGFDHILICADAKSSDPIELAAAIARDRAHVVAVGAVGLEIPRKPYYEKELNFIVSRSYGPGRYDTQYEERGVDYPAGYVRWTEGRNIEAMVDLMSTCRMDVSKLISHRFPITDAPAAYELITGKSGQPFLGVVLTYPEPQGEALERKVLSSAPAAATNQAIKVGVLGAGNYANATFLPAMQQVGGAELVGISSAAGAHAKIAADKYGFKYAASEESQILNDANINTVVLLTRHNQHARQALAALAGGKHVYCEKPAALTLDEVNDLRTALAVDGHPQYMLGFNRRFAPLAVKLKEFISASHEPCMMTYRVNAGPLPMNHWLHDPAVGGGRLVGEGCHFIDFMTWLCGSLPVEGTLRSLPDSANSREDNLSLTLSYTNGSVANLIYLSNGDSALSKEYVEVFSGGRVGMCFDFRRLETWHNGSRQSTSGGLRQDKGHKHAWAAFLQSIQSGQAAVPAEEIFTPAELTIRLVESYRSGSMDPIRLKP